MTNQLYSLSGKLCLVFAVIAAVILTFNLFTIASDVVLRNLGMQPAGWTVSIAEYSLLYITMLTAPWLVRTRGHVFVEALIRSVPEKLGRKLEKLVLVLSILVCLFMFAFTIRALTGAMLSGTYDVRAIDMPRSLIFLPMPIGFGLMTVEFFWMLIGRASMFFDANSPSEGL